MARSHSSSPLSSGRSEEELPLYDFGDGSSPRCNKPRSTLSRWRAAHPNLSFFGSAAILGALSYFSFSALAHLLLPPPPPPPPPTWNPEHLQPVNASGDLDVVEVAKPVPDLASDVSASATQDFLPSPGQIPSHLLDYYHLELDEITTLVARTNGFYARDYSLWLGWNNMRYIIDAAFIQARMLNRTLVLPSFVYARACEYSLDVCADFATMVNRGDAMHDDQWRELPYEEQMGYRIPLPIMLNITAMRAVHPVILVSDYLRLHGLPEDTESGRGQWERDAYHTHAPVDGSATGAPDLFVVQNGWYDPTGVSRVDFLPEDMKARGGWKAIPLNVNGTSGQWEEREGDDVSEELRRQFELFNKLSWDSAVNALHLTSAKDKYDLDTDEGVTEALWAAGWEVLHTFKGVRDSDLSKAVIEPTRDVAQRSQIRAWKDDYAGVKARVLLLEGETHNGRKAGAMRFTTTAALRDFQRDVLYVLQPTQPLQDLALELANRMTEKVEGRLWMGAHMRRGDFVGLEWVTSSSPAGHMMMVKNHLITGQRMLEEMHGEPQTYDIPDVKVNTALQNSPPPKHNDPFYVATDERDPDALQLFREQGAILLPDLMSMADRRLFGWPIMLTDVRAIVEQELLSHSAFFTGTHVSSVSGGILNMRAAHGADRRSIAMD